jgi:hypothetical protein
MNATLGEINLRKSFLQAKFFKMQPNALLAWQNFIMQKVGIIFFHPIPNLSWYHTFETITQRWFSKIAITFQY